MDRPRRLPAWAGVVISLLLASGCAPADPPSKQEVLERLSGLMLDPEATCEELKRRFGVEYLPAADTPADAGMPYEEHRVATEGSHLLSVWYLPATPDRGTVVLSQGAVGQMPCYLFVAKLLTENGWSLVMYDYRGFGLSSGTPSLETLRPDLEAVLDWTRERTGLPRVTLMGISLGTIPSVAVAVDRPDAVNAVVLDSPVAMGAALKRYGRALGSRRQRYLEQLGPELVCERLIARLRQPLLVFLSGQDDLTPPATIELLYERAGGPKRLARFEDLKHARGPYQATERYAAHLDRFLSDVWEQPSPATNPAEQP